MSDPYEDVVPVDIRLKFESSTALATCVQQVAQNPDFADVAFALIDLTTSGKAIFVGRNHARQMSIFSMAKIAPMLAAYALRAAVRKAAAGRSAKDGKELFEQITADWRSTIEGQFQNRPKDVPRLDRIFEANKTSTGAWTIEFTDRHLPFADLDLIDKGKHKTIKFDSLGFMDHLALMIGWSNNNSARVCVQAIGFQYMNGLLKKMRLYDLANGGGLWLSTDYDVHRDPKKPPPFGRDPIGGTGPGGTAIAVGRMMTLLAQDRLIDAPSSQAMKRLMDKITPDAPGNGTSSFLWTGLQFLGQPLNAIYSKIGIHSTFSDCIIVERPVSPTKTLKYVAVGINAPGSKVLSSLAIDLDSCIVRSNRP